MLSRVHRTIVERRLVARGDRILVAVSGGPDSMALLHALVHLRERLEVTLAAATVDHGLRPEAAREAADVLARCQLLGVPCRVLTVDVAAARGPHVSLQDGARRARLVALERAAEAEGYTRVALGHTADDQAETILFRIVRGTGVAGLVGIPYERGKFIRPLLDVRRREILAFLRRRRVDFVSDPANADPRFARSRIRHAWLPFLARENPRIVEALLALGASARGGTAAVPGDGLPAVGRRAAEVVRRLVAEARGSRRVAVPGGDVEITYGAPTFRPGAVQPPAAPGPAVAVAIPGPGVYTWPPGAPPSEQIWQLEVALVSGDDGPPRGAATFQPEIFTAELRLRSRRPGDRMRPRSGRGSRKLQDLLVDAKVPQKQRAGLPIVTTGAGVILFVPGLRPAEDARPEPRARRWVEIRVGRSRALPAEAQRGGSGTL